MMVGVQGLMRHMASLTSMAHKRGGNDRRPWNQNLCPQSCTFGHRHLLKRKISDEQHNKRDFQLLQSAMDDSENNNNNDMTTTISMITTKITMTKTTIEIGCRSGRGALLCLYPMDGVVINSPRAHLAQEKSHLASYQRIIMLLNNININILTSLTGEVFLCDAITVLLYLQWNICTKSKS